MRIRKIEPKDNSEIEAVIRSVMTAYDCVGEGYSMEDEEVIDIYTAYSNPSSIFYVIADNDKVRGGAGIAPLKGAKPEVCELKKMYFLPEIRGKGFGSKLLDLLLKEAKDLGYKQCYLETVERMDTANKLYAKYGFEKLCDQEGNTGHSGCDTYYIKTL